MEYWNRVVEVLDSPTHKGAEFRPTMDVLAETDWLELIDDFDSKVEKMAQEGKVAGGIYKIIPPVGWIMPAKSLHLLEQIKDITWKDGARKEIMKKDSNNFGIIFKELDQEFDPEKFSINQFYEWAEANGEPPFENGLNADQAIAEFESSSRFKKIGKSTQSVAKLPAFYISDMPVNLMHGVDTSNRIEKSPRVEPEHKGRQLNFNDGCYDGLRHVLCPYMPSSRNVGINCNTVLVSGPKANFCHHYEDGSKASANYLHDGSPKIWVACHPKDAPFVCALIAHLKRECRDPLHHKNLYLTLGWLKKHKIDFDIIVQRAGEIIVTRAMAIHGGFNVSWNVAEATNFTSHEWAAHAEASNLMPYCCMAFLPDATALKLGPKIIVEILEKQKKIKEGKFPALERGAKLAIERATENLQEKSAKDAARAAKQREKRAAENYQQTNERVAKRREQDAASKEKKNKKNDEEEENVETAIPKCVKCGGAATNLDRCKECGKPLHLTVFCSRDGICPDCGAAPGANV